jgi:predicted ribosomally synthesized peptide with nif11-like leader
MLPATPCLDAVTIIATFEAFQARIESDPQLQQQLSAAADAYAAAVVAIAREAGFSITAEQVQAAQHSQGAATLSDDDLECISGGAGWAQAEPGKAAGAWLQGSPYQLSSTWYFS